MISKFFYKVLLFSFIAIAIYAIAEDSESIKSGGDFSLKIINEESFSEPAPFLNYKQRQIFMRGRSHFNQVWVQMPSLKGDWGLGPTFITDKCSSCHVKGGKGFLPSNRNEQLKSMIVKISYDGLDKVGRPIPHPNYGTQFQNQGLMGQDRDGTFLGDRVPQEVDLFIDWEYSDFTYPDGQNIVLKKPKLIIENLMFGDLDKKTKLSLRMAQPIFGLGLFEAVPDEFLLKISEEQKKFGVNGRINKSWSDIEKKIQSGRFSWKSSQPSIKQQIAIAFHGDMGITSSLYNEDNCPPIQKLCDAQPPGNNPELIDSNWKEVTFWTRALAVPEKRNVQDKRYKQGKKLFSNAGCNVCHRDNLHTTDETPEFPQLANQVFHPYTDLMIHDMGQDLADNFPEFDASGRDWRTPPLWGIGLSKTVTGKVNFLHDGRAATIEEAILWHGGEAKFSKDIYTNFSKDEREKLFFFINSL